MSAIGPKQTWASAVHMSAFGGKADIDQAYVLAPQNFTPREHGCTLASRRHWRQAVGRALVDGGELEQVSAVAFGGNVLGPLEQLLGAVAISRSAAACRLDLP